MILQQYNGYSPSWSGPNYPRYMCLDDWSYVSSVDYDQSWLKCSKIGLFKNEEILLMKGAQKSTAKKDGLKWSNELALAASKGLKRIEGCGLYEFMKLDE